MKELVKNFKFRKVALAVVDAIIIAISSLVTNFFFDKSRQFVIISITMTVICCFFALFFCGAYNKLWRNFNLKDYLSCVFGILLGMGGAVIIYAAIKGSAPIDYPMVHAAISIAGICAFRYIFKSTFVNLITVGENESKYKRTMIIGGGQTGKLMVKEMHNAMNSTIPEERATAKYNPVCVIDDDNKKIGTLIDGVMVVGKTNDIPKFVKEYNIEKIIFAIPSCNEDDRRRILDICSDTKIQVKVLPFLGYLIFDEKKPTLLKQMRDVNYEDLLGREPIKFDNKDVQDFINGKICMVTGGGGSIGSELVRQISKYNPKQVIIVDIYENNAYDIQQELNDEYGKSLDCVTLIASVRDYHRMNKIFEEYKPQIVFHAAAHKHVPLMEASPMEAIKNNVIGTFNTATLAQFHNIEKFVMISTDKAVNPTNIMGASKRCCEMIVQYLSQQKDGKTEFVTTRFGNVLGSNGSVIPRFRKQIESGRPVCVTHPDIIRYFMTIPEAVSLVMEAAAIAQGGEIFVLDMGKPVRIVALAENLLKMYGLTPKIGENIIFTGLRPGEKIKEELLMDEEGLQKTKNKLIFIGKQIEIDLDDFWSRLSKLKAAAKKDDIDAAFEALHEMVDTFITPEQFNQMQKEKAQREALMKAESEMPEESFSEDTDEPINSEESEKKEESKDLTHV